MQFFFHFEKLMAIHISNLVRLIILWNWQQSRILQTISLSPGVIEPVYRINIAPNI